ncbi:replicative DNA helicase [Labrenzia sp. EL_126]|nr:replicative DNA helicase [Labrenzia sp. EL_126]
MNAQPAVITLSDPPANIKAEQLIIGALMANNALIGQVTERLKPEHFHSALNSEIYREAKELFNEGRAVNPILLKPRIQCEGPEGQTTFQYMLACSTGSANPMHFHEYVDQIIELATRRSLMVLSGSIAARAMSGASATKDLLEELDSNVLELRNDIEGPEGGSSDLQSIASKLEASIVARMSGEDAQVPLTKLVDLDNDMTGMRPGRLVVMAGRPGMGKSQTMVAFARQVARQGYGVGIASLEIDQEEWFCRLVSAEAALGLNGKFTYSDIQNGKLSDEQFYRFQKFSSTAANLPIKITDAGGLSASQIESRARIWKSEFEKSGTKLGAVFVDYLGLMRKSDRYRGNLVHELGELVWSLKSMAKRLDICVVLLAQLNRGVESRDDKRPVMSDLRDSGNIEEHADQVLLLYRPAYYDARDPNPTDDAMLEYERRANDLLIRVGKNRLGPCRDRIVYCDVATGDIANKSQRGC